VISDWVSAEMNEGRGIAMLASRLTEMQIAKQLQNENLRRA